MDSKYISFNNQINRVVKTPIDQGRIVALAIAQAVAAKAMMPSGEVENIADYFETNVAPVARELISEIGEGVIFSSKQALSYVAQFWKMRYNSAHPAAALSGAIRAQLAMLELNGKECSFDFCTLLAGGSAVVAPDVIEFLDKYKVQVLTLATAALTLLQKEEVNVPV